MQKLKSSSDEEADTEKVIVQKAEDENTDKSN